MIRVENLSIQQAEFELNGISFEIPAGSHAMLMGETGSGKTTILEAICGLRSVRSGTVWLNGVDVTSLKPAERGIGYVPQETILLHDSVMTNVTLGDSRLSEDDAITALRAAEAWNFVKALPDGIKSTVGERGGKLSGGQRQRIAIARALVHRPKLLILDESTTGLDPESEAAICDTLQQLRGELTILTISHQSALNKIADNVYRLQNGEIMSARDNCEQRLHSGETHINPGSRLNPGPKAEKMV